MIEEARRRHVETTAAEALAASAPAEPKRGLRMAYRPPARAAQGPPPKIVSLASAVGSEAAASSAKAPAPRAVAVGAWGKGPAARAAPVAKAAPGLGETGPAIPTSSSLCFGPELSADDLKHAVGTIVSVSRRRLAPPVRPCAVYRCPGCRLPRGAALSKPGAPSCQRHTQMAVFY